MSSIEKVRKGVYRVRFRQNGKQRARTFPTEKNAKDWQKALDVLGPVVAISMIGRPVSDDRTIGEFLTSYIDQKTGVTGGTISDYTSYIQRYMAELSPMPIELLDRKAVSAWVNDLESRGLSGKTIANVHGFLSAAMNSAVDEEVIPKNPCKGMRLPRTRKIEKVYLDRDEFGRLYEFIPAWYRPFVMTLVGTGMRFGEATALMTQDVDITSRSIRVGQAWKKQGRTKKEIGVPKTMRGDRTVAVPPEVADALIPLLDMKNPRDFVFTTPKGKVISQQYFGKIWTQAVQEFAGDKVRIDHDGRGRPVPVVTRKGKGKHPRVHDLRHSFASWAIQAGIPLTVIQRQLGHESITTTVNTYGHLGRADFDALAGVIATFLPTQRAIEG